MCEARGGSHPTCPRPKKKSAGEARKERFINLAGRSSEMSFEEVLSSAAPGVLEIDTAKRLAATDAKKSVEKQTSAIRRWDLLRETMAKRARGSGDLMGALEWELDDFSVRKQAAFAAALQHCKLKSKVSLFSCAKKALMKRGVPFSKAEEAHYKKECALLDLAAREFRSQVQQDGIMLDHWRTIFGMESEDLSWFPPLIIAWFTLARPDEWADLERASFIDANGAKCCEFSLASSKTDQFGQRVWRATFQCCCKETAAVSKDHSVHLCPVCCCTDEQWKLQRRVPLKKVRSLWTELLERAGINSSRVVGSGPCCLYSLRIGGTGSAIHAGLSLPQVVKLGKWGGEAIASRYEAMVVTQNRSRYKLRCWPLRLSEVLPPAAGGYGLFRGR